MQRRDNAAWSRHRSTSSTLSAFRATSDYMRPKSLSNSYASSSLVRRCLVTLFLILVVVLALLLSLAKKAVEEGLESRKTPTITTPL